MERFIRLMGFALIIFLGALGEYICGKIVLPEMGLRAPGFMIWFWFMTFGTVFAFLLGMVKEVFFGD